MNCRRYITILMLTLFLGGFAYLVNHSVNVVPTGPDSGCYYAELSVALQKSKPIAPVIVTFPYFLNRNLETPPYHNSSYYQAVYPFVKFFGLRNGFLIFSSLSIIIGAVFIVGSLRRFGIALGQDKTPYFLAVIFLPIMFFASTSAMQEPYFFAISGALIFLLSRVFAPDANAVSLGSRCFAMLCCVLAISAYPSYFLLLGLLLLIDLYLRKSWQFFLVWSFIGVTAYFGFSEIYKSSVSMTLLDNIIYGTKGFATLDAHYLDFYTPSGVFEWFARRIFKSTYRLRTSGVRIVWFVIPLLALITGLLLTVKNGKNKGGQILPMLLIAFTVPFFVQIFLAEFQSRHAIFAYPACIVGVFAFLDFLKKKFSRFPIKTLLYVLILCFVIFDFKTAKSHHASAVDEPQRMREISEFVDKYLAGKRVACYPVSNTAETAVILSKLPELLSIFGNKDSAPIFTALRKYDAEIIVIPPDIFGVAPEWAGFRQEKIPYMDSYIRLIYLK